jgi:hypothetical protein
MVSSQIQASKNMPASSTNASQHGQPSPAPGGNWSPQQQTARMLALCEAQMEAATKDSDAAIDTLVNAFTQLMATLRELGKLASDDAAPGTTLAEVNARCAALNQQVATAVVAFQFYDKLSQRLGHVRYSLSTMALFICDRSNSQRPEHWDKLLHTLGRLYRTAEERVIFDSIAGSLSLVTSDDEPPLAREISNSGSIELF